MIFLNTITQNLIQQNQTGRASETWGRTAVMVYRRQLVWWVGRRGAPGGCCCVSDTILFCGVRWLGNKQAVRWIHTLYWSDDKLAGGERAVTMETTELFHWSVKLKNCQNCCSWVRNRICCSRILHADVTVAVLIHSFIWL